MIFIDKTLWLKDVFAAVVSPQDLIRQPLPSYPTLSDKDKDQLRQTQVFEDETVQILGSHAEFTLVRKFEGTLGWAPSEHFKVNPNLKGFSVPPAPSQTSDDFFAQWEGTRYEFGGLSKAGIDCSGLSQLYYLRVLGSVIPKNSRDQRKLGVPSSFQAQTDHDLVFCNPVSDPVFHHVAIFFSGKLWHSRRKGGVVCQTPEEFLAEFLVGEVRTILCASVPTSSTAARES